MEEPERDIVKRTVSAVEVVDGQPLAEPAVLVSYEGYLCEREVEEICDLFERLVESDVAVCVIPDRVDVLTSHEGEELLENLLAAEVV